MEIYAEMQRLMPTNSRTFVCVHLKNHIAPIRISDKQPLRQTYEQRSANINQTQAQKTRHTQAAIQEDRQPETGILTETCTLTGTCR